LRSGRVEWATFVRIQTQTHNDYGKAQEYGHSSKKWKEQKGKITPEPGSTA
jgi:hypothetical protein